MNKLANVIGQAIKKQAVSEKELEKKTLDSSERAALSEILGFITESIGDDEDIEKFQVVRDSLSQGELQQLQDILSYIIEDEKVYPTVYIKLFKEETPLLKKVYNILDSNNLFDGNWDAMSGFEKICL